MEGVKSYVDDARELQKKAIDDVRDKLRKAAELEDPRDMWYLVRDILNLLTLLITPGPVTVDKPETLQGP